VTLSARALCKLGGDTDGNDGLKDEIGLASDATYDARLERLIESATRQITRYCGQEFHYESARVDDLRGYGSPVLHVSKTPLLSIGSIVYDPNGSNETISSDNYELDSEAEGRIYRDGGWQWTAARASWMTVTAIPSTEESLYRVTYECGYKTRHQIDNLSITGSMSLPEDLEDACLMLAAMRYRWAPRNSVIKSEKLTTWSATYNGAADSVGMPPEVAAILDGYRRPVWA